MNTADQQKFKETVNALATVYSDFDPACVEIWWRIFKDMGIETFIKACEKHIATVKYPPTPAHISEAAGLALGDPKVKDLAILAVDSLYAAQSMGGAYVTAVLYDRALAADLDAYGGWQKFNKPPEADHFVRKQLLDGYPAYDSQRDHLGSQNTVFYGLYGEQYSEVCFVSARLERKPCMIIGKGTEAINKALAFGPTGPEKKLPGGEPPKKLGS